MMQFRQFLIESENQTDVRHTLAKLPARHRSLVKPYRFVFQANNTINGDKEHVGIIDEKLRKITIAAPWNYGREYAMLHEIGHLIWKYRMDKDHMAQWSKIVKSTKNKQKQPDEELFSMAYANTYAKNKIEIHNHPQWERFIKKLN